MGIETVGLLSPGDMGHSVGKALGEHGLRVVTCLRGRSDRTRFDDRVATIQCS